MAGRTSGRGMAGQPLSGAREGLLEPVVLPKGPGMTTSHGGMEEEWFYCL